MRLDFLRWRFFLQCVDFLLRLKFLRWRFVLRDLPPPRFGSGSGTSSGFDSGSGTSSGFDSGSGSAGASTCSAASSFGAFFGSFVIKCNVINVASSVVISSFLSLNYWYFSKPLAVFNSTALSLYTILTSVESFVISYGLLAGSLIVTLLFSGLKRIPTVSFLLIVTLYS